ncbi:MAG TPA: 8-oxo-dGTP diphosphatase [Candidatus Moranbacteria bacterium]|nr:8-oxo-dGTP diphosphatase [Candidatus Moranbacteria bacterium]
MAKQIMTLCVIHQHPRVLLGMKKRGFGEGRYNGFGGKVHKGETIEEAAKREMLEEVGITCSKIDQIGVIEFSWKNKSEVLEVHIFKAEEFEGEPTESEEMKPEWFHVDEIPYNTMWSDDPYWVPLFLENKKFKGNFVFDDDDNVLEYNLEEI